MKENAEKIRHSLSHLMAMAVLEIFPRAKLAIGPVIENGFYYDFGSISLGEKDLSRIEKRMRELAKKDLKFKKEIPSLAEAKKIFSAKGGSASGGKNQPYKLELIKELRKNKKKMSIYKTYGNGKCLFTDLCSGPHVKSTKEINPEGFKLTKVAGAYWRGDEKNPMLTRIYGAAFKNKKELDEYLKLQEEAEKRDHRILGQKLELFAFNEEVGSGLPLWLPKGETLRYVIEKHLRKEMGNQGYQWVKTPHIGNLSLWKTSGHWGFYRENMYSPIKIDNEEYELKPMNCPFHVKILQSKTHSYKELPIKFAELGTVYRYERSGTLHGLTRVRGFTQDDAHIWCRPDQLLDELTELLKSGLKILQTFGFKKYSIYLSTRPEKYVGTEKGWQKATRALKQALETLNLEYQVDKGGGVFYGPKIDVKIKDSLGREWQCTTIQVDFNLPERFQISYVDDKGKKQQPIMVHRALLGSMERFIGVLLEHFSGALPLWLSPVQAEVINVGSAHRKYGNSINQQLKDNNVRTRLSDENLTVSKRIRDAEIQKIPYVLVVGDEELKHKTVNVRHFRRGQEGEISVEKLVEKILKEIENKTI